MTEQKKESITEFINRRMAEIEASGASEYLTGQIVAYSEIKKKIESSLEEEKQEAYEKGKQDAFDSAGVLTGEAAKAFEEYQNRPATQEEIDYMKRAEEVYKRHSPEEKEKQAYAKEQVSTALKKVRAETTEIWIHKAYPKYYLQIMIDVVNDLLSESLGEKKNA